MQAAVDLFTSNKRFVRDACRSPLRNTHRAPQPGR